MRLMAGASPLYSSNDGDVSSCNCCGRRRHRRRRLGVSLCDVAENRFLGCLAEGNNLENGVNEYSRRDCSLQKPAKTYNASSRLW